MKKIYESPMVELTVFDTEDIMTLSSELSTTDSANVDKLVNEYTSANTKAKFDSYSSRKSYSWK